MSIIFDITAYDHIPEETILCSQCGASMTQSTHPKCYVLGEVKSLVPVFCSIKCATEYDPSNLTVEKLLALKQWLPPPKESAVGEAPS